MEGGSPLGGDAHPVQHDAALIAAVLDKSAVVGGAREGIGDFGVGGGGGGGGYVGAVFLNGKHGGEGERHGYVTTVAVIAEQDGLRVKVLGRVGHRVDVRITECTVADGDLRAGECHLAHLVGCGQQAVAARVYCECLCAGRYDGKSRESE